MLRLHFHPIQGVDPESFKVGHVEETKLLISLTIVSNSLELCWLLGKGLCGALG